MTKHSSKPATTKLVAKAAAPAASPTVASGLGSTIITDVEAAASIIGGLLGPGKLSLVDDVARAAVKAAVATLDAGVDKLQASVDRDIASSPIAATAITTSKTILSQLGIQLPPEQQIVDGVKAAIQDLANAITPPAAA